MPHYSVATTKDKLSSLIDKALAGEEVVITRHGKPTVVLHVVSDLAPTHSDARAATTRLRARLASLPQTANQGRPLMEQVKEAYKF